MKRKGFLVLILRFQVLWRKNKTHQNNQKKQSLTSFKRATDNHSFISMMTSLRLKYDYLSMIVGIIFIAVTKAF